MSRVRGVLDIWRAGGVVLLASNQATTTGWRHLLGPNLLHIPDPLPPCITCSPSPVETDPETPTVVVSIQFSNDNKARRDSRTLMKGFQLARASIKAYLEEEDCDWYGNCWEGPSDFQVVRPGALPEVLPPDFVFFEKTAFLDTLARHKPIAIVSMCDSSNSWTQHLGPKILCVDMSWSPQEIAFRLLRLWHRRPGDPSETEQQSTANQTGGGAGKMNLARDGLEWTVSIIEQVGLMRDRRQGQPKWVSGWEMSRDVLAVLDMFRDDDNGAEMFEYSPQASSSSSLGAFFVLPAWLILGFTLLYIPLRDSTVVQRFRLRRLHHHRSYQNLSISAIIEELWCRLPDIDRVWNMWADAIEAQLSYWNETAPTLSSTAKANDRADHQNSFNRKRRAAKKRH